MGIPRTGLVHADCVTPCYGGGHLARQSTKLDHGCLGYETTNKTGLTRIQNFLLVPQLVKIEMQKCNMINLCLLVDLNLYSQS